ncbi:MAG: beta-ketoacyl-ACP synthase II [Clostridia bacterium]|nr:beta-ketoacyl-ACP synthase II [Clostridia bacterium]
MRTPSGSRRSGTPSSTSVRTPEAEPPRRGVVTGMGAVTPVGIGVTAFWESLVRGRSGVRVVQRVDVDDLPCRIGAEVLDFDPTDYMDRKEARRTDRFTQFAVAAAREAVADAGLDLEAEDPFRCGVVFGTGFGGLETLVDQFAVLREKGPARVSPFFIPMMIGNMAAAQVAILLGVRGPNETVTTACASSANAAGEAFRMIQRGDADVIITGGTEAPFSRIALAGFANMKAVSTRNDEPERASRPFDALRDGFVMGEGAGALVLESEEHARRRGARVYAEVVGYGLTADAHHVTQPPPDGEGGARSMRRALADAGLEPTAVDYINAHGTSTPQGDVGESRAIRAVFGEHADRLAVSSTKSVTGHLLGAAGAVELIACVKAIQEGVIPPTINYEVPDPACDLDYVPNRARRAPVRVALSNSFGFGGHNCTLIVRRWEA